MTGERKKTIQTDRGGVNVKQDKPDGYKGFLYLRCEHCGEEHAFNIKTPIGDYVCKSAEV